MNISLFTNIYVIACQVYVYLLDTNILLHICSYYFENVYNPHILIRRQRVRLLHYLLVIGLV